MPSLSVPVPVEGIFCAANFICKRKMRKGLGIHRLEDVNGEFATVMGLGMLGSVDNV